VRRRRRFRMDRSDAIGVVAEKLDAEDMAAIAAYR
jgi:hypothetical protein